MQGKAHRGPAAEHNAEYPAADAAARQQKTPAERVRALDMLFERGERELAEHNAAAARETLGEASELATSLKDEAAELKALRLLIKCAFFLRDTKSALALGDRALELARRLGDGKQEALVHNDLGIVLGSVNLYAKAVEHILASIRKLNELGEQDVARQLNNLGNIYFDMGEFAQALGAYQQVETMFHGDATQLHGIALGNIGRAQMALDRLDEAEQSQRRSIEVFARLGDNVYLRSAYVRYGNLCVKANRHEEALGWFRKALAGDDGESANPWREEAILALGQALLAVGNVEESIVYLGEALELASKRNTLGAQSVACSELAAAYERLGDSKVALKYYKEFHAVNERLLKEQSDQAMRAALIEHDVDRVKQERELYRLRNIELANAFQELEALRQQLELQNQTLTELSVRDPLTALHNRRFLDDVLLHEIARARRYERPLCVMVTDVDGFKLVNDEYSHAVGDEVLKVIGRVLEENVRASDVVARYGGEEFVVVFPELEIAQGKKIADKLRLAVKSYPWDQIRRGLEVTISCGVAALTEQMDREALLAAADSEQYRAKRAGRDRVSAAST